MEECLQNYMSNSDDESAYGARCRGIQSVDPWGHCEMLTQQCYQDTSYLDEPNRWTVVDLGCVLNQITDDYLSYYISETSTYIHLYCVLW